MASRRAKNRKLKNAMCTGKNKYSEKWQAVNASIRCHKIYGDWMRPYRCRFCNRWHIGHTGE